MKTAPLDRALHVSALNEIANWKVTPAAGLRRQIKEFHDMYACRAKAKSEASPCDEVFFSSQERQSQARLVLLQCRQ